MIYYAKFDDLNFDLQTRKVILCSRFSLLYFFWSNFLNAETLYDYKIIRVIDGDTVEIEANFLPAPLKPSLKLRIYGIDTPEKKSRANCDLEAELSKKATAFTQKVINESISKKIKIRKWDKYGGRVLGDIILDGKSLELLLLNEGLAKPYDGGKKLSWCNT